MFESGDDAASPPEQQERPADVAFTQSSYVDAILFLLWQSSYDELFALELEHNRALCGRSGSQLPPTSYRKRLKGRQAEIYDAKQLRRERDELVTDRANGIVPSSWSHEVSYLRILMCQRSVTFK